MLCNIVHDYLSSFLCILECEAPNLLRQTSSPGFLLGWFGVAGCISSLKSCPCWSLVAPYRSIHHPEGRGRGEDGRRGRGGREEGEGRGGREKERMDDGGEEREGRWEKVRWEDRRKRKERLKNQKPTQVYACNRKMEAVSVPLVHSHL